jgi:hypothetical protein
MVARAEKSRALDSTKTTVMREGKKMEGSRRYVQEQDTTTREISRSGRGHVEENRAHDDRLEDIRARWIVSLKWRVKYERRETYKRFMPVANESPVMI